MPNPVDVVKRAAVEAVEAGKPVVLLFGQVISDSPLKIQVDQKTILTEKMLILTRNVTDFEVDMSVSHITENRAGGSGDPAFASHNHDYKGRKKFKVAGITSPILTTMLVNPILSAGTVRNGMRWGCWAFCLSGMMGPVRWMVGAGRPKTARPLRLMPAFPARPTGS